jgi:hypothetical protein
MEKKVIPVILFIFLIAAYALAAVPNTGWIQEGWEISAAGFFASLIYLLMWVVFLLFLPIYHKKWWLMLCALFWLATMILSMAMVAMVFIEFLHRFTFIEQFARICLTPLSGLDIFGENIVAEKMSLYLFEFVLSLTFFLISMIHRSYVVSYYYLLKPPRLKRRQRKEETRKQEEAWRQYRERAALPEAERFALDAAEEHPALDAAEERPALDAAEAGVSEDAPDAGRVAEGRRLKSLSGNDSETDKAPEAREAKAKADEEPEAREVKAEADKAPALREIPVMVADGKREGSAIPVGRADRRKTRATRVALRQAKEAESRKRAESETKAAPSKSEAEKAEPTKSRMRGSVTTSQIPKKTASKSPAAGKPEERRPESRKPEPKVRPPKPEERKPESRKPEEKIRSPKPEERKPEAPKAEPPKPKKPPAEKYVPTPATRSTRGAAVQSRSAQSGNPKKSSKPLHRKGQGRVR